MKNILIPVDGSEYSMKAITAAKELAKVFGGKVTILNVVPLEVNPGIGRGHYMYVPTPTNEIPDYSADILADAKKQFQDTDIQVETLCKHGLTSDIIVDIAHGNDIDLVVMGSHGLGALTNRIMTGSVTTRVLHHIDKPVLVIK